MRKAQGVTTPCGCRAEPCIINKKGIPLAGLPFLLPVRLLSTLCEWHALPSFSFTCARPHISSLTMSKYTIGRNTLKPKIRPLSLREAPVTKPTSAHNKARSGQKSPRANDSNAHQSPPSGSNRKQNNAQNTYPTTCRISAALPKEERTGAGRGGTRFRRTGSLQVFGAGVI